ncbi:ATP-binding protein, partial [Achromobacter xylosoxidans]
IRLDESRDRGTGGTGLGLAIVSRVARWHNGSAEAADSPLGGARFIVSWKAA